MDTPSVSDSRMNSWRLSSHMCPVRVRKSMPYSHSFCVGRISRTKAWRWRTSASLTCFTRIGCAGDAFERCIGNRVFVEVTQLCLLRSEFGLGKAGQPFKVLDGGDEVGLAVALRDQRAVGFAHLGGKLQRYADGMAGTEDEVEVLRHLLAGEGRLEVAGP